MPGLSLLTSILSRKRNQDRSKLHDDATSMVTHVGYTYILMLPVSCSS